jgi:HAT1-interacting factor 1
LEYHPDASLQASAEKQVMGACTTLQKRLEALKQRQRVLELETESGEAGLAKAEAAASGLRTEKAELESAKRLNEEGVESKGAEDVKKELALFEKDDVAAMDSEQVIKEEQEVTELIQDLKLKLEEYSNAAAPGSNGAAASSSSSAMTSAKEKVQQAINEALLGSSTNALGAPPPLNPNAPINDLSSMVKKKKKPEESKANEKRKETLNSDEVEASKKIKVD